MVLRRAGLSIDELIPSFTKNDIAVREVYLRSETAAPLPRSYAVGLDSRLREMLSGINFLTNTWLGFGHHSLICHLRAGGNPESTGYLVIARQPSRKCEGCSADAE